MGPAGELALHPPLSLLYVASALQDMPIEIEILDIRLHRTNWRWKLEALLDQKPFMVGLTIMGGTPVENAIEVSQTVRQNSDAYIVWEAVWRLLLRMSFLPRSLLILQYPAVE
jgi:hypothetical protein